MASYESREALLKALEENVVEDVDDRHFGPSALPFAAVVFIDDAINERPQI